MMSQQASRLPETWSDEYPDPVFTSKSMEKKIPRRLSDATEEPSIVLPFSFVIVSDLEPFTACVMYLYLILNLFDTIIVLQLKKYDNWFFVAKIW